MAKLIGTAPNQTPTNADLGTMAYQDKDQIKVGTIESTTESGAVLLKTGDDQYSSVLVGKRPVGDNFANVEFDAGQTNGVVKIEAEGAGHLKFFTANTERMRIGATGAATMTGSLKPTTYQETYVAKSAASTVTCDLATGTSFSVTLDQNTTFAFTNPPSSGTAFSFTLFVTQHSTAVTLTWPNTVDWAGGSAPDAAAANEVQAYAFFTRDGGTTYYGFLGGTAIA